MPGITARAAALSAIVTCLIASGARAQSEVDLEFVAATAALGHAVRAYDAIWNEHGERIVAALEARTCLRLAEAEVTAVIADAVSHSGGPEHPMRLRASYAPDVKRATLVHELGHRHLWQLAERLDDVDGHMTLYLVLDHIWADVWGSSFADSSVRGESAWRAGYDYASAWTWARSLEPAERRDLWNRLLAMNGFPDDCNVLADGRPPDSG